MKYTETNTGAGMNYQFKMKLPPGVAPKLGKWVAAAAMIFFMNFVFVIFGIIKLFRLENYTAYNILFFVLLFIFAVGFSAVAILLVYKYVFIKIIEASYKYITPLLKILSLTAAEKYAADEHFVEKINKVFDIGGSAVNIYDKNAPWIVKKTASFFINRLPFVDFLKNLSVGIDRRDIRAVSECVYSQMDQYIVKKLFPNNNMKRLLFLFPANIAAQLILLHLIK